MNKILKYMCLKSNEFQLSYMFLLFGFNNINVKELFYIFDDNINDYRYKEDMILFSTGLDLRGFG